MGAIKIMSLNGQDMIDLIPKNLQIPTSESINFWRAKLLAAMIFEVDPDVVGLVEAPPDEDRTRAFVDGFLDGIFNVHQAEKRGALGLAFLVRKTANIRVNVRSKDQSLKDFKLDEFDSDGDGIREKYTWWNRVPLEADFSDGGLKAKTTFIIIHSKSKGAFIPGDLFAYERLSKANRMKLRAQANSVRKRLNQLVDENGKGRVVVMGDMNDGPEFDIHAALLGGCFLEPLMGSIWDPVRIFHNTHTSFPTKDRWTIDFLDRVVNPLGSSKYGQPSELRSWIDHILVSPELKSSVVPNTAGILHKQPSILGLPGKFKGVRGTDHHPPFVALDL
ncbi:MAG: endonuclease/exonuclease/phosphatase family protein [Syntrophales bacterium]|nr:endonuclease/exonuclease/phosphatase family protein [Syntrophales bacterium]